MAAAEGGPGAAAGDGEGEEADGHLAVPVPPLLEVCVGGAALLTEGVRCGGCAHASRRCVGVQC